MLGFGRNKTVGEIRYAIDHSTGLLRGSPKFKSVVNEHGLVYTDVTVTWNEKALRVTYTVDGVWADFLLKDLNGSGFELDYQIKNQDGKTRLKSTFTDLRGCKYEVIGVGAQVKNTVSITTYLKRLGAEPGLFSSCLTAFRAFQRNRDAGKLNAVEKPKEVVERKQPGRVASTVPTKTQGENLKSYQLRRRECVKELRDSMVSLWVSAGIKDYSKRPPVISNEAVREYILSGLKLVSNDRKSRSVMKKILRAYYFETLIQTEKTYPSAVEAADAGIQAIKTYQTATR